MIKKEFRDTLRILLESSVLLLAIPLTIGISILFGTYLPYGDFIYVIVILTVLAFACYSGLAMFRSERKDKGFEYLLTLPYSKWKIFICKWLPRLVVLLVLALLSALLFKMTVVNWVIPLILLQLGTVFLSLAVPSLFVGFIAVLVLLWFYALSRMFIIYLFYNVLHLSFARFPVPPPYIISAFLLLIPLGISFFLVYKNFDLKPYKYTIRPYFFIGLPLILLQAIIIFLYYGDIKPFS
jgi:hypothetical protein